MRGLVLSGGGDKGAYQAGVCFALAKLKREYDLYAGSSVGAINAAFLAQFDCFEDGASSMFSMWSNMDRRHIYQKSLLGPLKGLVSTGIVNGRPLKRLINKQIDAERIKNSGKMLRVVAVDLASGQTDVFHEKDQHIERWVLASSAFPVFFECVRTSSGEQVYTDGGVVDTTPLSQAINAGCTTIDVVLTAPLENVRSVPAKTIRNAVDVGRRVIQIACNEIWKNDLKICHLINETLRSGKDLGDKRELEITIYAPKALLRSKTIEFSRRTIHEMLTQGLFAQGISLEEFLR